MRRRLTHVLAVVASLVWLAAEPAQAFHFPWDQGHDTFVPQPPNENNNPPDQPNRACGGDPIDLKSGNFTRADVDFDIPGFGPRLQLIRTYHSQDNQNGVWGWGWHSNLTARTVEVTDGIEIGSIFCTGSGQRYRFIRNADGSYAAAPGIFLQLAKLADGRLQMTEKDGRVHIFDPNGYLVEVRDRFGNKLSITVDADGMLQAAADAGGNKLDFTHGPNGRVASATDQAGRKFQYQYDANGNLIKVIDPTNSTLSLQYDADHNLTQVTDALDNAVLTQSFDAQDRVAQQISSLGNITFGYDYPSSGQTTIFSPNPRTYTLDANGQVTTFQDELGNTSTFTYNSDYLITSFTDPNANTTTWQYDDRGNLIKEINTLGNSVEISYDATFNFPTSIKDPKGGITSFNYDSSGRLLSTTDAAGNIIGNEYDARGLRTKSTDPRGGASEFGYDAAGRLVSVKDPLGHIIGLAYDAAGNVASTTDALGRGTSFAYDLANRLTQRTNPDGSVRALAYDAAGNLVTETDEKGNSTAYVYDGFNRLTQVTDAAGGVYQFTYDNRSRLASAANPTGGSSSYQYDDQDNLTSVTDPIGRVTTFAYDRVGNVTSVTDPAGQVASYQYDVRNRLTSITDPTGATTRFEYDPNDNTTKVVDAAGRETSFTHDAIGRRTGVTDPLGSIRHFEYDGNGNVNKITTRNGAVITFAYDAGDQLTAKVLPGGATTAFSYDAVGNLLAATDADSAVSFTYDSRDRVISTSTQGSPSQPDTTVAYTYDKLGNILQLTDPDGGKVNYGYDPVSRLTSIKDQAGQQYDFAYDAAGRRTSLNYPNGIATSYSYDAANQLQTIAGIETISYTYDQQGSRTSRADDAGPINFSHDPIGQLTGSSAGEGFTYDLTGNRTTSHLSSLYRYDGAGRLVEDDQYTFAYDPEGNLVERTRKSDSVKVTFLYDAENRLVQTTLSGGQQINYAYDGLDRRVVRQLGGGAERFIYTGSSILATYDQSGAAVARYLHGPGIDEPLRLENAAGRFFYSADGLGSITHLTDATGAIVQTYRYNAFGELAATSGTIANSYTFTGREQESEAGLLYYRARYYDPRQGRFIAEDPLGFGAGDFNQYRYVFNRTQLLRDPDGRFVPLIIAGGIALGGGINGAIQVYFAYQNGKTGWDLATAFGHGFLSGATGTAAGIGVGIATGNPLLAGGAAGLTQDLVDQLLRSGGRVSCIDPGELAIATGGGVLGGALGKYLGGIGKQSRNLLEEARAARDSLAKELGSLPARQRPATITAGYNQDTGQVVARACGGGRCAEDWVVDALGGNKDAVRFTEAVRPRSAPPPFREVPVCTRCEASYGRSPFPKGTSFQSDFGN